MYAYTYGVDINVKFNQSTYYINENDKAVSLTVVLSERLNSTNVMVYINNGSNDNDGKCLPDVFNVITVKLFIQIFYATSYHCSSSANLFNRKY